MSATTEAQPSSPRQAEPVIDCDIHEAVASPEQVRPHLAREFHQYLRGPLPGSPYINPFPGAVRQDAIREDGTLESASLEGMRRHHLDVNGITYGVLTGMWNLSLAMMPQHYLASALATAYNDWVIDEWLEREPRLRGSVTVAPQLPAAAAREIDRVGAHPSMVQVCLPTPSPDLPYGSDFFHPIWEACVRNDLRVALHVAAGSGLFGPANPAGWPRSYMETLSQYSTVFEAQLISMVANGVFAKFPELRVVFIEGGFAWVPSVMWRMDQSWRSVRPETPWLTRRPSDYIRDHVRFSTQPFEEPDDPRHVLQLVDMMGSESLLMFATDYPHWNFDSPTRAIPKSVGHDLRRKILWENASEFYGLAPPR
jgi:predicted TIM-barrel fold metal-dependent hydrolase